MIINFPNWLIKIIIIIKPTIKLIENIFLKFKKLMSK